MLLYYPSWMFMGFIMHFYITFGTKLLSRGPAHIVVLLPVSVFRRKGISNGVQTEWNLRERDFWNERDLGDMELNSGKLRGGHEAGAQAHGGGRASHPCGQPGTLLAQLFYSGVFFWSIKNCQKFSGQLVSVWYSFSAKLKNKEKTKTGHGL